MSYGILRLSFIGFALTLIAGCGGGSTSGGSGGGGNSTTVTVNFTGSTPAAVATQVGSSAFKAATPSSTVSLQLPSGTTKFAVAFVCPAITVSLGSAQNQFTSQNVVEATTSDGTSFTFSCAQPDPHGTTGNLTFSVDASAISGATDVSVQAENSQDYAQDSFGLVTSNATLAAPAGTDRVDILAWSQALNTNSQYVLTAKAARSYKDQAVPGSLNSGNSVMLGAEDLVTSQSIAYTDTPSGFGAPSALVDYLPAGSNSSMLLAVGATNSYPALPSGVVQSGGNYEIQAQAFSTALSSVVSVLQRFSTAGPVTVDFPVAWSYPGPSATALPTMTFDYTGFSGKSGVTQAAEIVWLTGTNAQAFYIVRASSTYQGNVQTIAMPNLTAMPGFLPLAPSGTQVVWLAAEHQSDTGSLQPASGAMKESTVSTEGAFTVP